MPPQRQFNWRGLVPEKLRGVLLTAAQWDREARALAVEGLSWQGGAWELALGGGAGPSKVRASEGVGQENHPLEGKLSFRVPQGAFWVQLSI